MAPRALPRRMPPRPRGQRAPAPGASEVSGAPPGCEPDRIDRLRPRPYGPGRFWSPGRPAGDVTVGAGHTRDRAVAKKKTAKKTAKKPAGKAAGSSSSSKKKTSKKSPGKSAGRTVKKSAQKATGTKKPAIAAGKKTAKKAPTKKAPTKKAPPQSKKQEPQAKAPAPERRQTPPKPVEASAPAAEAPADKGRKGINVSEKKRRSRQKAPPVEFPSGGLLAPGGPLRKPLIPSGPKNVVDQPLAADESGEPRKTPFNKRQLEKFRSMLLEKRRELLGDITGLESEALKSADGADPRLGEHLEDQSSDAIDQAVSLDLAAADRRLLRMIDEALDRIDKGTYGLCVVTGKPIREERLRELPWASLSIEAARAEERRQMGRL
jgi:DnaK suppressor protein